MRYSLVTDGRTDSGALVIGSRFTVRNPKKEELAEVEVVPTNIFKHLN